MPHDIVMIVPKANNITSFPEEYHTMERVEGSSREEQAQSVGEAIIKAVELAQTHPNFKSMPNFHYVVMFAHILQDDA